MVQQTKKKGPVRKARPPQKRKQKAGITARINIGKVVVFLLLISFLVFSVGVVGYVVFFRVVIAAELPQEFQGIIFEEPTLHDHDLPHEITDGADRHTTAKVAIIIDDMGYHHDVGKGMLALDLNLTFSFLPHAPFTRELEEEAYQSGKAILLHLPLEPRSSEWDPGQGALYLEDDQQTHEQILDTNLLQVPHATGVNNHMGSRYTEDDSAMTALMEMLKKRQLYFIDSYTTSETLGYQKAREGGLPTARRQVFLDNVQDAQAICDQIEKLVTIAALKGIAIGIGHPHPETLEALSTCAPALLSKVSLVAAGELVN